MYNQQRLTIPHSKSVVIDGQALSPPSTTLTPSSTPSTTPSSSISSNSSIPISNITQISSLSTPQMQNPLNFPQNINQTFNNGMLNTALYNDPTLLQLFFSNLIHNQNIFSSIYPFNCNFNPYLNNSYVPNGLMNGINVNNAIPLTQTFLKENELNKTLPISSLSSSKQSVISSLTIPTSPSLNDHSKSNLSDNTGQSTATPDRNIKDEMILTEKTDTIEDLDTNQFDASLKKRRKETSIDSINSVDETVATETNSNVDESSATKHSRNDTESLVNDIIQEEDMENQKNNLLLHSHYLRLKQTENKDLTNSPLSNTLVTSINDDEVFLSSDRKTSFDKILRIHSSLIGSLSWTIPTDRDDIILKSPKESISTKSDNLGKTHLARHDEYNPFQQRDYNSANVTCFSPRMLPDWQLNWLRDVTRSLSNVPKSPMTGIHFDRTKPAWAVSYYECETRKYYFFFIPDLSEYTIEITLAAAIGCRQNVVARGAHKRKKPGVLTFNLYSGQFEKSNSENNQSNQNVNFNDDNNNDQQNYGKNNILTNETHLNNSIGNNIALNRNPLNIFENTNAIGNIAFPMTGPMNTHAAANPAQIMFPHIAMNAQQAIHPSAINPIFPNHHSILMDSYQQNALRNTSLLYAAALSSTNPINNNLILDNSTLNNLMQNEKKE